MCSLWQYIPNKPIKWGIKVWTIAGAKNGYVSNFNIYLGKSSASPTQEHSLSTQVVLMVQPFQYTHRHLYIDNYVFQLSTGCGRVVEGGIVCLWNSQCQQVSSTPKSR